MLSPTYRQRAARAVFGSARSELIPAVLWLGWLNGTTEVTTERVKVPNTDAVFGPSGDGVTNIVPIDAGVADVALTLTAVGLYDSKAGGTLLIAAPLPNAVTVAIGGALIVDTAGLVLTVA